ncbi:MAG: DNA alkylation repair protein [Nanoarchaeota archaeon]
MTLEAIVSEIRKDLKENIDEEYRKGCARAFKEEIKPYGVRFGKLSCITKSHLKEIKKLSFEQTAELCEKLLKSGWFEETSVAFAFMYSHRKEFKESTIDLFEEWIEKYVHNWAHCDDFCTHTIGFLLEKYPLLVNRVFSWTDSKNRWMKRASAVSYVIPAKNSHFLKEILQTAEKLLYDEDDLVRKGVGWMLKEYANHNPKPIIEFVDKYKKTMPRTTLRYAIEKLPKETRKRLMEK